MIERLLEADRLLALGLTDQAERIYWQAVETDSRNAIAVVGLARVASERGDDRTALEFARKAREIDPESPAAVRLTARLEEIIATREESAAPGAVAEPRSAAVVGATPVAEPAPAERAPAGPVPAAGAAASEQAMRTSGTAPASTAPAAAPRPAPARPAPRPKHQKRRGLLGRLLGGR
jgi:tetratricopeptide (TPR) repeat protein